ncbi:hypothetical protein TNCV_2043811 [Trichonephila clavipes]|nr:hypothetical protein TNCV_2043811 [Trichonephila clavipes]
MNAVNIQPVLEEQIMDVDDAQHILEDNAVAEPILEDNAAADPILEDIAAAVPVWEDNLATNPVIVDKYMEQANGEKEEFYPYKT